MTYIYDTYMTYYILYHILQVYVPSGYHRSYIYKGH